MRLIHGDRTTFQRFLPRLRVAEASVGRAVRLCSLYLGQMKIHNGTIATITRSRHALIPAAGTGTAPRRAAAAAAAAAARNNLCSDCSSSSSSSGVSTPWDFSQRLMNLEFVDFAK